MDFLKSLFFKNDLERTNSLGLIDLPPPHLQRRNNSVKEKINSTKTKFAKIKGRYIRYYGYLDFVQLCFNPNLGNRNLDLISMIYSRDQINFKLSFISLKAGECA